MKISDLREQLLILENEQLGHKRSIVKEQEQHEKLTALVNKNEADLNTIKKQTLQVNNRYEADKQSYSTYSRMLQETERNLANAVAVSFPYLRDWLKKSLCFRFLQAIDNDAK